MTIYRAWPDMPALLGDLMTREWGDVVAARLDPTVAVAPDAVAEAIVTTVRALRENELFTRILTLDPELLLPYLLDRRGRAQQLILDVLGTVIDTGQQQGTIRAGAVAPLARGLVLAAHGFVLSAHTMVDGTVDPQALESELHALVVRALAP
ncbi:MAG: TetR/AcrR family transcriptional regulator [Nocardioidaceae bacterium]|nr:TetR/AcrR family transcriptional regulator [Nocardioidaceae bacterium]